MSRSISHTISLFALVTAAGLGCARSASQAPASAVAAGRAPLQMHVLAFADTASVRFEVTVPDGAALAGAPVRGRITSIPDGNVLWTGSLGSLTTGSNGRVTLVHEVTGISPRVWSPASPALYRATFDVERQGALAADTIRFGFRKIESRDGQILLNGRPVFLRGNAINPPGRNLPDSLSESPRFAAEYMRYLKSINVNIIRLTYPSEIWFDAADEQGVMIFQGHYGTPRGASSTSAPTDPEWTLQWYRDSVIAPQANHPSIVIYALTNEQAAPEIGYLSRGHEEVAAFLQRAYDELSAWDDTRLYIGNAGYGFGRAGEICDLHRYWGWYYNSFLSFYEMRDPRICWRTDTVQPMTMTENTGNYTGPDGRYNLVSNTKQPDSQLNWTGHAPDDEQPSRALAYQAWMAGQAIEIYRRLRQQNPNLAGLSPFTIAFSNWHGATGVEDLGPKPVTAQYRRSFQPVLLSWESWTPNVYAGSTIRPRAHVVNDAESGDALLGVALHWSLRDSAGTARVSGTEPIPEVPYYGAIDRRISITIPATLPTGQYTLAGSLLRGGDTVSYNETGLFVAARSFRGNGSEVGARVRLYDPDGRTAGALRAIGVRSSAAPVDLRGLDPARDLLVVGSGVWDDRLTRDTAVLRDFVSRGGRAIILDQRAPAFSSPWLPAGLVVQMTALDHSKVFPGGRPFGNGMAINPERPSHPVFDGLTRDNFFLWSDHSDWDESKPGFPAVYPVTHGLAITEPAEMGDVAVLANYDHGLHGVALAEVAIGRGSVLLSGFDIVDRVGLDPVADRFLFNLVRYMGGLKRPQMNHRLAAENPLHPLIDSKITWGDYASERGLVTGINSGLLLHTVPRVPAMLASKYPIRVDDEGFVFAGAGGGWNTKPAIQYYGRGRRAFGPYTFTTGGSVSLPRDAAPRGIGRVWMTVPASRTTMITTIENPIGETLEMEISVNGAKAVHPVPPFTTVRVPSSLVRQPGALRNAPQEVALEFRGDRRLVLLETDFR